MQIENVLKNPAQTARMASLSAGTVLVAAGISRRSLFGLAVAGAGGYLLYDGLKAEQPIALRMWRKPAAVNVERSVTIQKSSGEVFDFLRGAANLPRFMSHLEAVEPESENVALFRARGPFGMKFSWKAKITEERTNSSILWQSLEGSDVKNSGRIELNELPADRGTELRFQLNYIPPAGKLGWAVSMMLGKNPEQTVREDLRHLKQLLEAGEFATTSGQPAGPRSRAFQLANRLNPALATPRPAQIVNIESRRSA